MRFSLALALAGAALTTARGLPRANEMLDVDGGVFRRANCDTVPSAKKSRSSPRPVAAPVAATAADCQAQCAAIAQCQSFVFGANAAGPVVSTTDDEADLYECLLYAVAVSEIPKQADAELKAYDRACTDVPATTEDLEL